MAKVTIPVVIENGQIFIDDERENIELCDGCAELVIDEELVCDNEFLEYDDEMTAEQEIIRKIHEAILDCDELFIPISRHDVETGNTTEGLDILNKYLTPELASKYKHHVTITFSGYEDDPREVFEIPEIKMYMMRLTQGFPYWYYFLNIENGTLDTITGCLCRARQIDAHRMQTDPNDLINFYEFQLNATYNLAKVLKFNEEQTKELIEELNMHYIGMPNLPE